MGKGRSGVRGAEMQLAFCFVITAYETAGRYHNGTDAEQELRGLPKGGGKKSAVVISTEVDDAGDDKPVDSSDTEYDTDGEPKPKTAKPRPLARRSQKEGAWPASRIPRT